MELKKLIQLKRNEILRITAKYGANDVRVIGSVARNQATSESDIDFLVRFDSQRSLLDHAALIQELESLLKCKVDIASELGLRDRVRDSVISESIAL